MRLSLLDMDPGVHTRPDRCVDPPHRRVRLGPFLVGFTAVAILLLVVALPAAEGALSFSHRDARNAAPGASEQETAKTVAANLWVDANGGGCRRSRTPVDYSDAAACPSFDAAYQAAEPGDIVRVVAGTYPYQELRAKAGARAPNIVIQAAVAGTVVVKEFEVKGADYLTIRNLTVTPFTGRSPSDKLVDIDHGTTHLTLDNVDLDGRIGGVRQVRDGLGISGDTDYVTVRNSDICCIQDNKLIQVQTYRTSIQNRHLTLSGNTIHDVWQTDSRKHLECLWLEGVSDFLLEGNHFWDCALNAILANADEGGTYANWTIVNNVFEDADAGVAGVPPDVDGCAETHAKSNWLIAYNYFSRGLALTSCRGSLSWLTMRGNIGAAGDFECGGGGTWEYNTWAERKCSSTDTENRSITAAGNYVGAKAKGATGPGDYRPSSTAAPQIDTGHPTSWPAADAGGPRGPYGSRPRSRQRPGLCASRATCRRRARAAACSSPFTRRRTECCRSS